jgi:hypothetical protein
MTASTAASWVATAWTPWLRAGLTAICAGNAMDAIAGKNNPQGGATFSFKVPCATSQ